MELLIFLSRTLNETEMAGNPRRSASNAKWTEVDESNRMIIAWRLIAANNIADDNHSIATNDND